MSPADAATGECDALREENALLREHIRATDSAAGIAQELVIKTGQRCTAIRRVFAPKDRLEALLKATQKRLEALRLGDPREEGVDLGPLASLEQKAEVEKAVAALLEAGARVYWRHPGREDGAFFPPTLLLAEDPWPGALHQVEYIEFLFQIDF